MSNKVLEKLARYPDVVNMEQFMQILSAKNNAETFSWKTAKWILDNRDIEYFMLSGGIKIPLVCIKNYLQSRDYQRDRLYYPSLCDESLSFVVAVNDKGKRLYHRHSYGENRKRVLTLDIEKAYHYKNRFRKAVIIYSDLQELYEHVEILKIDERGKVYNVQSDLCY